MDRDDFSSIEKRALMDLFDDYSSDFNEVSSVLVRVVKAYIQTIQGYEEVRMKWQMAREESTELNAKVTSLQNELQSQLKVQQDLQFAMSNIRRLLDKERKAKKLAEEGRDFYETQVSHLSRILNENINKLSRETKEQFHLMKKNRPSVDLLEQQGDLEMETTASAVAELSYTRDEEDLNLSSASAASNTVTGARAGGGAAGSGGGGARKRATGRDERKPRKKRRSVSAMRYSEVMNSSDRVVATTTVTVDGSNVHATAVIESHPPPEPSAPPLESDDEEKCRQPTSSSVLTPSKSSLLLNSRTHTFIQRTTLMTDSCNVCNKKIKFSGVSFKCRDCKTVCHAGCRDKAPLPCAAPTPRRPISGLISDYTPIIPPMVPALVVHCVNEVEARGLSEVGIYRVSGSEREVRALVEKFKRGKGLPNLSQIMDIHVICSTLKDFLRSLSDPLTTAQRWRDFVSAIEIESPEEKNHQICKLIRDLPQPNRDTLAYLILHLQRVAEVPDCKMSLTNLASVFGPTVIGHSNNNNLDNMLDEIRFGNRIMEELLKVEADFWERLLRGEDTGGGREQAKPSTPHYNSPLFQSRNRRRKVKYFETP